MSCGGIECPAWCECVNERCVPSAVRLNAMRFRMRDGRWLYTSGGAGRLSADPTPTPGPFHTFYFTAPPTFEASVLTACGPGWEVSGNIVRVDPRTEPHPKEHIKHYRWGGTGCDVWVSSYPLSVPGHHGAEEEYTVRVVRADGSSEEPTSGDDVLLVAAEGTYFRVRGPAEQWPGTVTADGAVAADDTVFRLFVNEVRPADGWRPGKVVCMSCAPVTGLVRHHVTGEPVAGAHVVADGTGFEAVTDEHGRFALAKGAATCVPAGAHTLTTTHGTHLEDKRQITVEPEVPLDVVIDLRRNCAPVTGLVRDFSSGEPLAGAVVVAEGSGFTAVTDAQGRFTLAKGTTTCVPQGMYVLTTSHDTHQEHRREISVAPETAVDLETDLTCTPVSGVVRTATGTPAAGVKVFLMDAAGQKVRRPGGGPFIEATTRADGTWTLRCVPHGPAGLTWFFWTAGASKVSAFVPPLGVSGVELVTGCVEVRGTVTDAATGNPVAGATVTLTGTSVAATTTDIAGAYQFACAPLDSDNRVTVSASYTGYLDAEATVAAQSPVTVVDLQLVPVPPVRTEPIVLTLTWGSAPADLDSHLSGPDTNNGRFHLSYASMSPPPVTYVALDVDAKQAFGPENVTITPTVADFVPGQYRYWVHNFTGGTFENSLAVVTVAQGTTQLGQYTVAAAVGAQTEPIWHVLNVSIDAAGQATLAPQQKLRAGDANTRL
ncbi:carboxypeptidase regulatory-like domain-containing protein [Streptomyces sp. Je 1-369]|uniref:carboxypeptidase regulatory-like domain-containing protein n=1 Tax=Streptomyces sp. Je 1-369 TaxID=2966192 RepID=UPI002285B71B|nr:carboxypeptidase regulatory-like domain-containing protein [Streptomyces sp. Je 1-369]WAL96519.1 carboxypeptidase regulatory-like domain-containing protein [Streptomyces sp. Je 1-369]